MYERMIASISDVVSIVGTDGIIRYKSPNVEERFGWRPEEQIGTEAWQTVHPDDRARIRSEFDSFVRSGERRRSTEFRYRCRDGSYRLVELTAANLVGDSKVDGILLSYHDVTEERDAAQALRERELQFRNLSDQAPVGIFRSDTRGRLLYANPTMARILGFSSVEETVGRYSALASELYVKPQRREEFIAALREHGVVENFESQMRTHDGRRIVLSTSARAIERDEDGSLVIEGFTTDITGSRGSSDYETVFNGAQEYMFLLEVTEEGEFRFTRNNRAHELATGITTEDMRGHTPIEVFGPDLGRRAADGYRRCVDEQRPYAYEEDLDLPSGRRTWATTLTPVIRGGSVVHIIGASHDITERKLAERRLKEYTRRLELTMNAANMSWWELDVESGRLNFDEHKAEMLGYRPEEFPGYRDFMALVHPDDQVNVVGTLRHHLDGNVERYDCEYRVKTKAGAYKWFRDVGSVTEWDRTGAPVRCSGVMIDISDQKRSEDRVRALLSEKELLLKEVHHRIKNNLSTVESLLSLQAESLNDAGAIDALQDARSRLRSMGVLYDKLYRADKLGQTTMKEYLDALSEEVVRLFPGGPTIRLDRQIDDFDLPVKDLANVGIIVNELLTNAMKHAFGGRSEGVLAVRINGNGDRLVIVVEDDGTGLPDTVDIDNSPGFGLSLVGILSRQMHGSVRIEREAGTRFRLVLRP